MSKKENAQEVITSYKKRQQWGPFIIGAAAVVLVVAGIFILIFWVTGTGKPILPFLASKTPTPTKHEHTHTGHSHEYTDRNANRDANADYYPHPNRIWTI